MNQTDRTITRKAKRGFHFKRPAARFDRVTVPAPLWAPKSFSLTQDDFIEHREGTVVELLLNGGCAVRFDGHPNVCDYGPTERAQFIVEVR